MPEFLVDNGEKLPPAPPGRNETKEEKKARVKREGAFARTFTFGARIRVLATARRERVGGRYKGPRWWARIPASKEIADSPAIFLKHTMFFDGEADLDPEDGRLFSVTNAHRAAWICIQGRAPERVFLDSIELVK